MPLSINVGLSRKASRDYQSTGYSINVTAELDQSLLARPEELQQQIAGLYQQAESALQRQAGSSPPRPQSGTQDRRPNSVMARTNGHPRPVGRGGLATESQKRAIQAICRRIGSDPEYEATQLIGCSFVELSVKQASELIDSLKALEPEGAGGNGGGQ